MTACDGKPGPKTQFRAGWFGRALEEAKLERDFYEKFKDARKLLRQKQREELAANALDED